MILSQVVLNPVHFLRKCFGLLIDISDGTLYEDSYLVLLNSKHRGWNICETSDSEKVKLCKEYGKNPNNFFYFFSKGIKDRFEFFETKTMENE